MMSDVEITIKLPEELVQDAEEFGVLNQEIIASLLRKETDTRSMDFVNGEIKAYRTEKLDGNSSSTHSNR